MADSDDRLDRLAQIFYGPSGDGTIGVGNVGQGYRPVQPVLPAVMDDIKNKLLLWARTYLPPIAATAPVWCWNSAGWQSCHENEAQAFIKWWNANIAGKSIQLGTHLAIADVIPQCTNCYTSPLFVTSLNWWASHNVINTSPACPTGFVWNVTLQKCVPVAPSAGAYR